METNTKLNILKHNAIPTDRSFDANITLFIGNSADYGGAVYVNDDTNRLVHVLVTQEQTASFKCLLSTLITLVILLLIQKHSACIFHKTMPIFQVPLSMEDYWTDVL